MLENEQKLVQSTEIEAEWFINVPQLQRESEDLCGHRGLLAGTDDQTFSMALPGKLRNYYDKVVTPAMTMGQGAAAGPRAQKLTGTTVQQMVQAYGTMNKFLTRFLEHVS